jgi:hypothetical protein
MDRLPSIWPFVYITFIHSDAWDAVVDYFALRMSFRAPNKTSYLALETLEEPTWNISITVPHFELGNVERSYDFGIAFQPTFTCEEPPVIMFACISVCLTGDKAGEFWTCSVIGKESSWNSFSLVSEKLEKYKHDKYSARDIAFILQVATACQTISDRYESILTHLDKTVDLKVAASFLIYCFVSN